MENNDSLRNVVRNGSPDLNSRAFLVSRSHDILMGAIHSGSKVSERKKLLAVHPELCRRIDTNRLKAILDYTDFRCHPKCSIARDEAIEGSDIDVGVVVLKERGPEQKELEFVEELRRQGFTVYHQREYEAIEEQFRNAEDVQKRLDLIPEKVKRDQDRVHFYTKSELIEMSKKPIGVPVAMVYLAGKSIG